MAFIDSVNRMRDRQYATMGVAARWTPAGGDPVDFTGLLGGGDEAAEFQGFTGRVNIAVRALRARVSEFIALAPGITPLKGDQVDLLDAHGDVTASFVVNSDPRHPQADARRLEWLLPLGDA